MFQAVQQLLKESFLRKAIPVLIIVLAFNVIVQFRWFESSFPFIHRGQLAFHRFLCAIVPRPISPKWVRAVEIDDALHRELGEPTNRNVLASLIRNAARGDAMAVLLDVKLLPPSGFPAGEDEPGRTAQNKNLLQAIEESSDHGVPVIVPCWLKEESDGTYSRRPNIYLDRDLPIADEHGNCAHRACAQLGNINLPTDERQVPLVTPVKGGDGCSHSFALAAASAYENVIDRKPRTLDKQTILRAIKNGHFVFSSFIVEDRFQKTSARALAAADPQAMASCRGRIVLIGGKWHSDLGNGDFVDRYDTPVGQMQGMYLHANYVEALLDDRYQAEVPVFIGVLLDLGVGGALYLFFHKANSRKGKLLVLGVFMLPLTGSYIVFANLNFYLDFILPLSLCFLHLLWELGKDYIRLRQLGPSVPGTVAEEVEP